MYKSIKYRIYPNEEQKILINKTFGCCRFYWNVALDDNIKYYEENKKSKINTPTTYKKEYPWLCEVDSHALCNVQLNLQKAFNNFFKRPNMGFPIICWIEYVSNHKGYSNLSDKLRYI